jgi:hypothetical protein
MIGSKYLTAESPAQELTHPGQASFAIPWREEDLPGMLVLVAAARRRSARGLRQGGVDEPGPAAIAHPAQFRDL